jgi:TPR repeat protein
MYLKGQGVKKNNTEARKWFQKAADAGYKNAEKALKSMGNG